MGGAAGVTTGLALGIAVLVHGVRLVARGRREGRAADAGPDDRTTASLRVAAGVRLVNRGVVILLLVSVAAYVWR